MPFYAGRVPTYFYLISIIYWPIDGARTLTPWSTCTSGRCQLAFDGHFKTYKNSQTSPNIQSLDTQVMRSAKGMR